MCILGNGCLPCRGVCVWAPVVHKLGLDIQHLSPTVGHALLLLRSNLTTCGSCAKGEAQPSAGKAPCTQSPSTDTCTHAMRTTHARCCFGTRDKSICRCPFCRVDTRWIRQIKRPQAQTQFRAALALSVARAATTLMYFNWAFSTSARFAPNLVAWARFGSEKNCSS